ncbi:MAG: competence/damage-inducible protein A [Spirochaetota bacterium]
MIALLVIGDEILAGDIREENISFMIDTLSREGHRTGEVRIVRDDVEMIANAFRELASGYDYVISAGGVGPTHDDVTLEAAARGFGVDLELNREMETFLSEHYAGEFNDSARQMAKVPQDSEIIFGTEHRWPIIKKANAFILPGLPMALRDKMVRLARMLPPENGGWTAVLYLRCDETEIADWLSELQERNPATKIGSYPVLQGGDFHTRITIKSTDPDAARRTFAEAKRYLEEAGRLISGVEPAQHLHPEV